MHHLFSLYDKLELTPSASHNDVVVQLNKYKDSMSEEDYNIACMILLNAENRKAYNEKLQLLEAEEKEYNSYIARESKEEESDYSKNIMLSNLFVFSLFTLGLMVISSEFFYIFLGEEAIITKISLNIFYVLFVSHIVLGIYLIYKEIPFIQKIGMSSNMILVLALFPPFYFYERSRITNTQKYASFFALIGYFLIIFEIVTSLISMNILN